LKESAGGRGGGGPVRKENSRQNGGGPSPSKKASLQGGEKRLPDEKKKGFSSPKKGEKGRCARAGGKDASCLYLVQERKRGLHLGEARVAHAERRRNKKKKRKEKTPPPSKKVWPSFSRIREKKVRRLLDSLPQEKGKRECRHSAQQKEAPFVFTKKRLPILLEGRHPRCLWGGKRERLLVKKKKNNFHLGGKKGPIPNLWGRSEKDGGFLGGRKKKKWPVGDYSKERNGTHVWEKNLLVSVVCEKGEWASGLLGKEGERESPVALSKKKERNVAE